MKQFIFRYGPAIVIMGLIYLMSSFSTLPGSTVIWWDVILKKTAHMIEYGLLFFFWSRAINWHKPETNKRYWLVFLIVLVYAASDEFHQSFTPGRHPKITDIGFDMLGGFLMYARLIKAI